MTQGLPFKLHDFKSILSIAKYFDRRELFLDSPKVRFSLGYLR